jgi:simple sugar transport system ATP-binding protein
LILHPGEILGIAGVDGNGQTELAESLLGLRSPKYETLTIKEQCLHHPTPATLRAKGVAFIPQDRQKEGLALNLSIEENLLLNSELLDHVTPGVGLPPARVRRFAEEQIARFSITPPIPQASVSTLSGGNQQRVLIARELSTTPDIIIAANPTRGLDIGATQFVHQQLRERQQQGVGVILISTDLDEIFALSTSVYVLYRGMLQGPVQPTTSREIISQMMSGVSEGDQ